MQNYFTGGYQRIKVNNGDSAWSEIIERVSQRSILAPLLSNIFLYYLFLYAKEFFYGNTLALIICTQLAMQWIM